MSALDVLRQRAAERDALLERAVDLLKNDRRVVAAWLYGSLGRGTEDALSDIDLWVVVLDEQIEAVQDNRREYAAALGKPLLIVDAPQNAPPGGAFLSVLYEGKVAGPQHVDWTWQAHSAVALPRDAKVLFKRIELAEKPASAPVTPEGSAKAALDELAYFWMMVPIIAKYVVRRQPWVVVNLLSYVVYALDKVRWLLGASESRPEHPTRGGTPPPVEPVEQLTFLRELAGEAEKLVQSVDKAGTRVTSHAISQVYKSVDLARRATEGS